MILMILIQCRMMSLCAPFLNLQAMEARERQVNMVKSGDESQDIEHQIHKCGIIVQ